MWIWRKEFTWVFTNIFSEIMRFTRIFIHNSKHFDKTIQILQVQPKSQFLKYLCVTETGTGILPLWNPSFQCRAYDTLQVRNVRESIIFGEYWLMYRFIHMAILSNLKQLQAPFKCPHYTKRVTFFFTFEI